MSTADDRLIGRVTFKKTTSDGNYGVESAEVSIDVVLDEEQQDLDADSVAAALALARRLVHDELRNSPNQRVRDSLIYSGSGRIRLGVPDEPEDEGDEVPL